MQFRRVAVSAFWLSIARIVNPLTSVLLVAAVARTQGASGLGQYSLILTIFYMAIGLAGLGLATPITRTVATDKGKAPDFYNVTTVLGLSLGIAAVGIVKLVVTALGYSTDIQANANLLMWAVVPSVLILHYDAILLALDKAQFIAVTSIFENVAKVAIGLTVLLKGFGISTIFTIIVALRILVLIVYFFHYRLRVSRFKVNFDWDSLKVVMRTSPVFTTNLVASTLFGRIDVILLSKLGTMTDVGIYSAALRLVEIAALVPFSLKRAALPAMCETFHDAPEDTRGLFDRCLKYMSVFGVGVLLSFIVFADLLIDTVFGADLATAAMTLRAIAPYVIFASLTPILGCLLFAAHLELRDLVGNLLKIGVLVVSCAALIPQFGVYGATTALVLAEFTLLLFMRQTINRIIMPVSLLRTLTWPIVGALCAYGVAATLHTVLSWAGDLIGLASFVVIVFATDAELRQDVRIALEKLLVRHT